MGNRCGEKRCSGFHEQQRGIYLFGSAWTFKVTDRPEISRGGSDNRSGQDRSDQM